MKLVASPRSGATTAKPWPLPVTRCEAAAGMARPSHSRRLASSRRAVKGVELGMAGAINSGGVN